MDVAPAAAEVAVEAGAVVEVACVQQYAAAVAWVRQQAVCMCAAACGGGQGNDCDGQHAASVRAAVGSGCGMHVTACSGGSMCAAAAGSGRQHGTEQLRKLGKLLIYLDKFNHKGVFIRH